MSRGSNGMAMESHMRPITGGELLARALANEGHCGPAA
jgi:hypothetical protein